VLIVQNLPLTILSKEEGIPIPDNIFSFSLTHEASQQFKVSNVELRPGVTDKFFAIAISNEGSIALELCSTEEERMQNTEPIGVVALLISTRLRHFSKSKSSFSYRDTRSALTQRRILYTV